MAGTVEAVGTNVTEFALGDQVYGTCNGSFAEYAVAQAGRLTSKPANLSYEQAAAIPVSGLTALQGVRDHANVQPGQKVLINAHREALARSPSKSPRPSALKSLAYAAPPRSTWWDASAPIT
jgi:D-arabinose 1-dehydrogenase-like Zn-dependent alcohol dehydrogenase